VACFNNLRSRLWQRRLFAVWEALLKNRDFAGA